jgi:uncharacterized protein
MLSFRKNKIIRGKIEEYLSGVAEVIDQFQESMEHYLKERLDDHFNTCAKLVHGKESKADDLRREIEGELFRKSLLPEVREDIIKIIDLMDTLVGCFEKILQRIYTHNIVLPETFSHPVKELVDIGLSCARPLEGAVLDVLGPCEKIKDIALTIDTNESVADKLEAEILYDIFHNDYEPFDKLMYRDLVEWISSIPDMAERISDQLTIFAIKRNV